MKTILTLLALTFVLVGCKPNASESETKVRARSKPEQTSSPQQESTPEQSTKGEKPCFNCGGSGLSVCGAPGCNNGQADCPGPCLKLSKGAWEHMEVKGHKPDELWQKFYNTDDNGWQAWNQNHVGEVIEIRGGKPVNTGKCKICGGQARVKCTVCKGTGQAVCGICDGKKVVPENWTAFNNPKLKNPPGSIQLKDGRTIFGKIEIQIGSRATIRTVDGKQVEVDAKDIVSAPAGK